MLISLVDPGSAAPESAAQWNTLRRVHFYISDLIADALESMSVSIAERRILDGLVYVEHFSVAKGVTISDLCSVLPSGMKTQTVGSTLARLEKSGQVVAEPIEGREQRVRDKHLWRITSRGHHTRDLYIEATERILREVYAEAFEDQGNRFRMDRILSQAEATEAAKRFQIAMDYMDERYLPVLELGAGTIDTDPRPERDMWAVLRRTHFYINDLIYRETEPMGIGPVERRVLDALAFAYGRGATDGIPIATICDLNRATNRQSVTMALERMSDQSGTGWVTQSAFVPAGRRRGRLWNLTERGRHVRRNYARYARHRIQETYDSEGTGRQSDDALFEIAASAERYRNRALEPIIARFLGDAVPPR